VIDLKVPYVEQQHDYDCWLAALTMVVWYRRGNATAPVGHPAVLSAGEKRHEERQEVERLHDLPADDPNKINDWERKSRLKLLPWRGLNENEYVDLAQFNGLSAAPLPARDLFAKTGGWTSAQLDSALNDHGPLWCATSGAGFYGHAVVVKGVNAQGQVIVHDPRAGENLVWELSRFNDWLTWTPHCVLYLPA